METIDINNYKIIDEDIIVDAVSLEKVMNSNIKKCVCKIAIEIKCDGQLCYKFGTGFFCHIKSKNLNFLMTNNHVLNKEFLHNPQNLTYYTWDEKKNELELTKKNRYKITNEEIDFTIIEIIKEDKITDFIEVDENISLKNFEIKNCFCFQYPGGKSLQYSHGKIFGKSKDNNYFIYSTGTMKGSSGSPILSFDNKKLIGLHKASYQDENKLKKNIGIPINIIINKINFIKCKCFSEYDDKEIQIINNGYGGNFWKKEFVKCNNEIETKIKVMIEGEIKPNILKYKFNYGYHKILLLIDDSLTNASCMFSNCKHYKEIDLSNFKTEKIKDMSYMFYNCWELWSLDFSSFKTDNVTNMSYMFFDSKFKKLDLSSFNTINVKDMSKMFGHCIPLESVNVSSFQTDNVIDMSNMFDDDCSLKKLDLKSFKIDKVKNMKRMFYSCYNLKKLDLSNCKISDENQTDANNTLLSEIFDVIPASCKLICSDEKIIDKFNNRIKYTNDCNII